MRKKILLSIAALAITTLIGGMAFADTFTVNSSSQEGEKGSSLAATYAPFSQTGGINACSADTDGGVATGNCNNWGDSAVNAWLNNNFMNSGAFVPTYDSAASSGYTTNMLADQFGVGKGLPTAWLTTLTTSGQESNPLTAPSSSSRDEWVDQIAIGYIKSTSNNFVQNFRSQLTFGDSWDNGKTGTGTINRSGACATDAAACLSLVDQRLEQGDPAQKDGIIPDESAQAFQQAFQATSGINVTTDPSVSQGSEVGIAQNVEQAGEGFFYSCLNCDTSANEHKRVPPAKLSHQTWPTRPTITRINHGDDATQTTWTP